MATVKGKRAPKPMLDYESLPLWTLVTLMEVAEYSRYSYRYLYNLRGAGKFVSDDGHPHRYRWSDVLAWLAQRKRRKPADK